MLPQRKNKNNPCISCILFLLSRSRLVVFSCCSQTIMSKRSDSSTPSPSAPKSKRRHDDEPSAEVAAARPSSDQDWKLFNDPIHGPIEIHPLLIKIIDTPQFQRLRDIKQLGTVHYVYYGATHSRFEHSIGTCYLAGKLIKKLKKKQPELGIDDEDVLCVQIAGLCHDLGHGPYSHLYQDDFLLRTTKWKHEDCSLKMFDHLMKENNMKTLFQEYGLGETHIEIIKVQIGPRAGDRTADDNHKRETECQEKLGSKKFLLDIVANKKNGVDVDKWDYIARDSYYLGLSSSFDHRRIIKMIRVIHGELCVRDKGMSSLYEMYSTRNSLHQKAYKHKTTRIVALMIAEAMNLVDDVVRVTGVEEAEGTKISEATHDMSAFTNLTDHILHQILFHVSDDSRLRESKKLLQRIKRRDLYRFVGELNPALSKKVRNKDTSQIVESFIQGLDGVEADDVLIDRVVFDYGYNGSGRENPLENMKIYKKDSPNTSTGITPDQVSTMLPQSFKKEEKFRFYCKRDDCLEAVKRRCSEWENESSHYDERALSDGSSYGSDS